MQSKMPHLYICIKFIFIDNSEELHIILIIACHLEILQVKKSFNAQFLKLEENLTEITWWQPAHLEAGYSQFVSVVTYFVEF